MPDTQLVARYQDALSHHQASLDELASLSRQLAVATLAEVLPGTSVIEALGQLDEDWVPRLRIQRVLDEDGRTLFDIDVGHPDRAVEDTVDLVDIEYLDVLIDLAGDEYMGRVTIS